MKKNTFIYLLAISLLSAAETAMAQGAGSSSAHGGTIGLSAMSVAAGGTVADLGESIYIGPGTYTIDGTWEIYSKNVWISPDAVISGSGSIQFYNPSVAGGTASPTLVDGNNSAAIDVNMVLRNASGMQLVTIAKPADATSWNDNTANNSLVAGKNLDLSVDGATITLGITTVGDLIFDTDATISNYRPLRMVVTNNSITSHVVKQNYTGSFVFPVGITAGDYTPAKISNTVANTFSVSVQNYTGSSAAEPDSAGIRRTWNIYAANAVTAGGSTVQLQHNTSTAQSAFREPQHFVSQYSSATPNNTGDLSGTYAWQRNTAGAADANPSDMQDPVATIAGSSMRQRIYGNSAGNSFATSATDAKASFTKLSDVPDLTPTLDMDDLNFTAAGVPRDFVVNIYNIGQAGTNNTAIIFRIPKLSAFTITYSTTSGTSNVFGGTANENSNWTFSETASFITITSKPGVNIAGDGQAILGFTIERKTGIPGNTSQNITPVIFPGAGGEVNTTNNNVVTTISTN